MNICIATVETRNFTFDAFGANEEEARTAMEKVLQAHARQYAGRVSPAWVTATIEQNVTIRTVQTGTGYRDREEVPSK